MTWSPATRGPVSPWDALAGGTVDQGLVHAPPGAERLRSISSRRTTRSTGFQIQEFDPIENRRDGFKLVLVIKSNRVEQFMEDDEDTTSVAERARSHQGMDQAVTFAATDARARGSLLAPWP